MQQNQTYDPIQFEIAIQSIATDILDTPYDESLPNSTMRTANAIAKLFSANRDQIFKDFTPPLSDATTLLGVDVDSPPDLTQSREDRASEQAAKKQFRSTAKLIQNDTERTRAISEWLHSLPNPNRRKNKELDGNDVIESLLMIDADRQLGRIAFSDIDLQEAESILHFAESEQERLRNLEASLDGLESTEIIAEMIIDRLHSADVPLTKLNIWTDEGFRQELRATYPGITNDQIMELFRSGWSYIEAYFKEIDPNFELFTIDKSKSRRGTRYALNEKELVKELWDVEHSRDLTVQTDNSIDRSEELPSSDTSTVSAQSIRGDRLVFTDGSSEAIKSPVLTSLISNHFKGLKRSDWLSRANVAQKIADELGLKKSDVEAEMIEFIKKAGKGLIETVYSRAGNRILIRKGINWRH